MLSELLSATVALRVHQQMAFIYPFLANIANTRLRARFLLSEIISGKIIVETRAKKFRFSLCVRDRFLRDTAVRTKKDVENIYNPDLFLVSLAAAALTTFGL